MNGPDGGVCIGLIGGVFGQTSLVSMSESRLALFLVHSDLPGV